MGTDKFISKYQLESWVNKLAENPAFIQRLDEYERQELKNFIQKEMSNEFIFTNKLLLANPTLEVKDCLSNWCKKLKITTEIIKKYKISETALKLNNKKPADKIVNSTSTFDYFKLKDPTKQDNLTDVFDSLVKNKFIKNNKANKKDFKNIFADVLQKNRIKWIGTAGELSYFIKLLCFSTPPKVADMKNKHWEITLQYFEGTTKDNKPFDTGILRGAKQPTDHRKKLLKDIISANF